MYAVLVHHCNFVTTESLIIQIAETIFTILEIENQIILNQHSIITSLCHNSSVKIGVLPTT